MRTIARVYETYGQAREVVADLEECGVATSDINLIANRYVCEETARIEQPSAAGRAPASVPRSAARPDCSPVSASSLFRASARL
jgi:hypothetical protein